MEVDEDNSNGEVVVLATKNDCTTKELNKKESRKLKRLHREAIQTTYELASDEEDLPPIKDRQDGKDTTTTTQSAIKSATPNGDVKKEDEESSSSDKAQDEGSSSDEAPDESPEELDHHTSSSSDDSECVITEETTTTTKKDDKKSAEKPSSPPQPDKDGDDDDDKIQDGGDKEDAPAADDDDVEICSSDSDDQVLADIAVKPTTTKLEEETEKPKPEEKDKSDTTTKGKPPPNKRPRRGSKEQTIIVTETKSLAQAINEAVKKPDGKPTLVIIETKTPSSTNASSNGMVSTSSNVSSGSSTTTSTTKSIAKVPPSSSQMPSSASVPSHNSLRSALLQGSGGMATRSQNRPSVISQSPSAAAKPSSKTEAPQQQGLALKDDAEINVYTPSLLVPYLFECPPKEYLKDFLKKIAPPEVVKAEEEKKKEEQKALDDCEPPLPKLPTKPKTFFDTSLGQFFVDIGLSQVQQWVQSEIYKSEKKKLDRGWKTKDRERMVKNLQKTLVEIRHKNSPFEFVMKRCKRCNFATESKIVMERHLETIHMDGARMQCSFCNFETIDPSQIFQHLFSQHKAFGRLERPPNTHMCPMCPFEDSAKARVTRHSWKCTKTFVPEKNMCPPPDFEPPAKRIRHVASVATLKAMRAGVEKSDGSSATPGGPGQNRSSGSLLTPLLAQQRGPPPIRPKPGDLRLTPTYVQSVLRGSYVPPNRGPYPGILTTPGGLVRTSTPLQGSSSGGSASFLASRGGSQQSSSNSPAYSLQGNQIYQVVHTSGSSNVPVFRGGAVTSFTPPRFTILPTPPAMVNTRGPTPVALIPNLATNTKPGSGTGPSGTSSGIKSGAVSVSSTGSLHASVTPTGLSKKIGAQAASHLSSKPNISITPVSKPVPGRSSMSGSQTSKAGITPVLQSQQGRQGGQQQQNNPSYVVCEICDGYIKDLDQLRNHMQWIHKVKIHPKMIHNRPPLNCQKCHFRFFTDQGLERHLLGSHGLVTSSMQENANKGKDGGRCIICGKVFLWKLVVHMAKDHKMTLKPAHLSYKCTVCSATFNMYRLFETHVYEEHSTVAKRVLDGQKTYPSLPSSQTSSTKAKVTITPTSAASSSSSAASIRNNKSIVVTPVTSEKSGGGSGAVAEVRCPPAELRPCKECGVKFQPAFNCVGHPDGKAPVKPCHIKLCRVDRCAKCVSKAEQAEEAESGGALNGKPKRDHGDVKHESSSGGKSGSGATSKTSGGPPAKIKTETEHESKDSTKTAAADAVTTNQSDGDDVFDMEVETVDDDHPSPGDVHTDVESD